MRIRCHTPKTPDGRDANLTPGETCEVLGMEAGDLRLLDDTGSPVLFDPGMFQVVDGYRPTEWVSETIDGVEYAGAPEFSHPGFWEDFYEHDPSARAAFARYLNRHSRGIGAT